MRRSIKMAATAAAVLAATPSLAAITVTATPGSSTYVGPTPTFNFDGPTPGLVGGAILTTSTSSASKPEGSSGGYLAAGPTYGTATLTSSLFAGAGRISFVWGSVDPYNYIRFLDGNGSTLAEFNGSQVLALTAAFAPGDQFPDPIVYFTLSGADSANLRAIQFISTSNSFEIDNISVAVPEPATWGMMIMGFAAVGMGMRRRKAVKTSVSFG